MRKIKYKKVVINTTKDLYIHPIGDTHIGHQYSDIDYFINKLSEIPKDENNRIIIMGDMLDTGIKTAIAGSVYEQNMSPHSQIDCIIEALRPYKEQIDGYVIGNHEYRIFKDTGIDICKIICDALNIEYFKYSGIITYSMPHKAYNFNFIHGNGGGTVESALRKVKAMSQKVISDVYLMGHTHQLAYTTRVIKQIDSRNEKAIDILQYFILTGHCLNYEESYADQANLEISPKGFPIIKLFNGNKKKVEVFIPNERD